MLNCTCQRTRSRTRGGGLFLPSLVLDFADRKALDPRITFTRATTGTYYDGTTAMAEQNLLLYSQQIDIGTWAKTSITITADTTAAPDGTTTADTLTATAGTNLFPRVSQSGGLLSGTANVVHTASIFAKAGTIQYLQIFSAAGTQWHCNFDLTAGAGAVGTSDNCTGTITSVGGDWYRCVVVYTPTTADIRPIFCMQNSSTAARAAGWNPAGTETLILWGAQLEQRSGATAYTPTTTAAVTNYIPRLVTAAADVARFDHVPTTGESLGLLVEEQRANLWRNSVCSAATVGTVGATGVLPTNWSLVAAVGLSVDVVSTFDYSGIGSVTVRIYGTATSTATFRLQTSDLIASVAGTTYTSTQFVHRLAGSIPSGCTLELVNTSGTANVVQESNFIYSRLQMSGTTATALNVRNELRFAATLNQSYDVTFMIGGAQLEAGAFATSYIPTGASQVTRNADSATMTGTNFSSWYRADEGTLVLRARPYALPAASGNARLVCIDDGTVNNRSVFMLASNNGNTQMTSRTSGSDQASINVASSFVVNQTVAAAGAYKADSFGFSVNGSTAGTDTSGTVPSSVTQLVIGSSAGSTERPNGTIARLTYYPARLTNTQLQALTT